LSFLSLFLHFFFLPTILPFYFIILPFISFISIFSNPSIYFLPLFLPFFPFLFFNFLPFVCCFVFSLLFFILCVQVVELIFKNYFLTESCHCVIKVVIRKVYRLPQNRASGFQSITTSAAEGSSLNTLRISLLLGFIKIVTQMWTSRNRRGNTV
jgi:hypothetical protein